MVGGLEASPVTAEVKPARLWKGRGARHSFSTHAVLNDDQYEYINYFLLWAMFASLVIAFLRFMRQAYEGAANIAPTKIKKPGSSQSSSNGHSSSERGSTSSSGYATSGSSTSGQGMHKGQLKEEQPEDRPYTKF